MTLTPEIAKQLMTMDQPPMYDVPFIGRKSGKGWKISVQGKNVEDGAYLADNLIDYLVEQDISFKIATSKRYSFHDDRGELANSKSLEQSRKAMTIYCPDDMDVKDLAKEIQARIPDYKGWDGVNSPQSYEKVADGLFVRNDRDTDGQYIHPN